MRYLSLFSGIEAASVAWGPLGWEPVAFCEIDEFPSAVLAYRFPNVPNLGDITKVDWYGFYKKHGAVDVMVGGSPCQSFSIAGNREGRAGESGLMAEYIRCVRELVSASGGGAPRYIVWENVPGALSSERGVAFGQLLAELGELGYGLAWRVLDAQFVRVPDGSADGFFGPVPQRRRRVFLVGSLGSPGAAEILFERSCLRGDHPKGAEARKALAEDAHGRAGMGDSAGFKYHAGGAAKGIGYEVDSSPTLTADYHQPAVMSVRTANTSANGHGIADEVTHTLGGANGQAVAFEQNQRGEVRLNGGDGTLAGALASSPAQTKGQGASLVMTQFGDVAGTLSARADSSPCVDRGQNVVFQNATIGDCGLARESDDCSYAQYAASNGNPIYEYVCCSCGHRFASADGPIENEMDEDWFKIACPKCGSGRYADASKVKVICAADDNGKTAVEEDMCGSLKVGGGSP